MAKLYMALGALFCLLGVGLGAFGAHVLRERIGSADMAVFTTAVEYQRYHGLALLGTAAWLYFDNRKPLAWAASLFTFGILVFSGSLYMLVATGARWFGAITPIGGACFLAGWLSVLAAVFRLPAGRHP